MNAFPLAVCHSPLRDSIALYERAQKHITDFHSVTNSVWSYQHIMRYTMRLNRDKLALAKPIIGDAANNVIHSLDQVLAACLKMRGASRKPYLHYLLSENDAEFSKWRAKIEPRAGPLFLQAFEDARQRHKMWMSQIIEVKKLSNSVKHWSLIPTTSAVYGIAYTLPGKGQTIVEIPPNHFEHNDRFAFDGPAQGAGNLRFETLIQFRLKDVEGGIDCVLNSAFSSALAHTKDVILEVAKKAQFIK